MQVSNKARPQKKSQSEQILCVSTDFLSKDSMNSFEIDLVNMDELCKLLEIEISAFQNFQ